MAHFISAIVAKAPIDRDKAAELDLPVFEEGGFATVALFDRHAARWAERLGSSAESATGRLIDAPVVLDFARALDLWSFALVATEYFGGVGEQFASVFEDGTCVMEPTEGGINAALRRIGVECAGELDEFDTVGLGKRREFSEYFKAYW